jgi:hypothetical protein
MDRSTIKEISGGEKVPVFAGKYSDVWQATGISQTYYKPVREALERHGAILILQKGSRAADTVIVLRDLPNEDEWNIDGWRDGSGLTNPPESDTLRTQVEEIENRLGGINVVAALAEFEKRVETLEQQVAVLQGKKVSKIKK